MYTGYFAKLKKYQEARLVPVSIALKSPDWYHGLEYKQLAPNWDILSAWKSGEHKGDVDYYTKHFEDEVLDGIYFQKALNELEELTKVKQDKIILLCYEKSGDFCHRHIVAEWLGKDGISCTEYKV